MQALAVRSWLIINVFRVACALSQPTWSTDRPPRILYRPLCCLPYRRWCRVRDLYDFIVVRARHHRHQMSDHHRAVCVRKMWTHSYFDSLKLIIIIIEVVGLLDRRVYLLGKQFPDRNTVYRQTSPIITK